MNESDQVHEREKETDATLEDVDGFRHLARAWIRQNLPPANPLPVDASEDDELAEVQRHRQLQRMLFDAGFAGIIVPKEYGGAGLTHAHVEAFNEEIVGYDFPSTLQIPGFTPVLPVILEFGTHEQKLRHVPPLLRGEHILAQFLSEPGGGSDAAGAQTTAVRDGDEWILNGSKIWTSSAWKANWGLCLARTNWDVEKHRGLSVFLVSFESPGLEVRRIEMLDGSRRFCQEFLTDVRIPDADRIGDVNEGWTVGIRWMYYERKLFESPFVTWPAKGSTSETASSQEDLVRVARRAGKIHDSWARNLIGEMQANSLVTTETHKRISQGMRTGYLGQQGTALIRVLRGVNSSRQSTVAFELTGNAGFAWDESDRDLGRLGIDFLSRQTGSIGGGTTEIARNVISERLLGMPREQTGDRGIPYRDVPKGAPNKQ